MMAEEGTTDTTDTTDTTTTDVAQIIGEDGLFAPGWQNALPEEIRTQPVLGRFKSIQEMAKGLISAERMVGKDRVVIPTEKSSQDEWTEFYEKIGRPKTGDEYQLEVPDDLKDYYDTDLTNEARKMFYNLGLNQKQAQALWEFDRQRLASGIEQSQASQAAALEEARSALRREWGTAYDARIHMGNVAIDQGVGDDDNLRSSVVGKFGSDPDFVKFMANLGGKFAEHGVKVSPEGQTPGQLDELIKDEMATDAYMNPKNPAHKITVNKVHRMFEKLAATRQS